MDNLIAFNFAFCILGCFFLVPALMSIFIYKDAIKRKIDYPILWALMPWLLGWMAIAIYIIVVRSEQNLRKVETVEIGEPVVVTQKPAKRKAAKKKSGGPVERY